jgi:hypothetical protein
MKIFPSQAKNHKLKACICGINDEKTRVNKNIYHNIIFFTLLGALGFIVLTAASLFTQIPSKTWIIWAVMALYIAYLTKRVMHYKNDGHKILCSVRRIFIDLAAV